MMRVRSDALRIVLRSLALGLGALHTAVAVRQQSMSEDGINYLDIGTAAFAGEWETALNTVWSPLYALILGGVQRVVAPSVSWEFPVVQMTNFVIYAAALFSFEFFWRALPMRVAGERDTQAGQHLDEIAPRAWLVLGYSLFIWSSLSLVTIWAVTPDMLVAAGVYLAAGLVLRVPDSAAPRRTAAWLGIALGAAYLAKAAMFPLGLVLVGLVAALPRLPLTTAPRLACILIPFVLVSGPLVAAVSARSGHFSFSEVGAFTYMKHVNELRYPHWGASIERVGGAAVHPPTLELAEPEVYAFAEPITGTYPLAFDPAYWTEGLAPTFTLGQQLRASVANVSFYADLFARTQGGFLAVVLVLGALAWRGRTWSLNPRTALAAWALSAFGLYVLVYAEARYVAPFVAVLWGALLASLTFPHEGAYRRVAAVGGAVLVACVWFNIAGFNMDGAAAVLGLQVDRPSAEDAGRFSPTEDGGVTHPRVAEGLLEMGLQPGDPVGFIGDSFAAYWARLARLRIVAEIPLHQVATFWQIEPDRAADVLQAFTASGAVAVVAARPHGTHLPAGWRPVGDTSYVIRLLHGRGKGLT